MNAPSGEKRGVTASAWLAAARRAAALDRRRWISLAASIAAGVLVGTLLWVGGSRNSLEDDVLEHLRGETDALAAAAPPAEPAAVARVLERGGIRLRPEAGAVRHANSCRFRGRTVPHLVLQAGGGPVTVLVLRHERPAGPRSFAAAGFSGRIVPAGPGSLAVAVADGADLERVTARVLADVEWL